MVIMIVHHAYHAMKNRPRRTITDNHRPWLTIVDQSVVIVWREHNHLLWWDAVLAGISCRPRLACDDQTAQTLASYFVTEHGCVRTMNNVLSIRMCWKLWSFPENLISPSKIVCRWSSRPRFPSLHVLRFLSMIDVRSAYVGPTSFIYIYLHFSMDASARAAKTIVDQYETELTITNHD